VSKKKIQTVDLNGDYIEHIHRLTSQKAGWDGIDLIYENEPAGEMPETYSARHLIVLCLGDFQAEYSIDGSWQRQNYNNGDIIIFPAGSASPKTQIDREVGLIELFIAPKNLVSNGKEIAIAPQLKLRDPLIEQIALALKTELELGGADSRLYAESMTTALSAHLLRRYATRKQEIKTYSGGLPKYKLNTVISYINEYLDRNLSFSELAALVKISPHYFSSLFKQSTGLTPYQYVTKCRIEKAKQLLVKTDIAIAEIALQVGFQNQSHFTRVFRKLTNITPKAYRNNK